MPDFATLPLHDDEPTLEDHLGRGALVCRLADLIAECHPPQVFGIHGDWGAGKTSFLYQLQWALSGKAPKHLDGGRPPPELGPPRRNVTVVTFEAWRYQHEKAPIVALLHEVRSQLSWSSKARREAGKLGEVTVRSALLAIEDLTKKIGIQASKIQQAGEKWERDNLAAALPSDHVRQHLRTAIGSLLGGRKKDSPRLVVLVDDLDRCEPAAAYALLEGIKIYLNLPNCVFVLGMNQKVVEGAIADQLPDPDKDPAVLARRSREYLEKICQHLVHLPLLRDPAGLLERFLDGVPSRRQVSEIVGSYHCLPANARKVKAFANLLRQHAALLARETDDRDRAVRLFVTMACLYQFHPEIYRLVEAHGQPFWEKLRNWARGHREGRVHPRLAELEGTWTVAEGDPQAATAEPVLKELTFADPVEGNVLRVQRLIADLENVTKSEIDGFLLR